MANIKRCTSCNGTGLINRNTCPVCKGFGVPLFDEDFENAKLFLGEEDDLLIDLDEDDD